MNEQNTSLRYKNISPFSSPRRWALAGIASITIGAMSIAGISHANDGPGRGTHHHGMHGPMDPATASKRIDRMIERMLSDGTPEQKAKVSAIAKAALNDLQPLREKHRAARADAMKILSQPTIDRTALEKIRASELQLADQISRRMTQAMADAAEVLTPEQRATLAERFKQRMKRVD